MGLFTKKDEFQNKKLDCPRCKVVMKKLKHPTGAILDVCNKCGGMWLDREEVIVLFEAGEKKPKSKIKPKKSKTKPKKT